MKFPSYQFFVKNRSTIFKLAVASTSVAASFGGVAYCGKGDVNGLPEFRIPTFSWYHKSPRHAYDYHSVRRGFQVFKEVCSACHHCRTFSIRHLVGATHTLEEAKEIAKEYTVTDGPNNEGEMYERPMKIIDYWKSPYKNNVEAALKNNGALPPEFTFLINAQPSHESFIVHLLNNYDEEPPPGVKVPEGVYYNIYAKSQLIAMPPPLYNGQVEYEDGTPATVTQMAADVAVFMRWLFDPHLEERKRAGLKAMTLLLLIFPGILYMNRSANNLWRYRKVLYHKINWK